MSVRALLLAGLGAVLIWSSTGQAAPIFDGTIDSANYHANLADPVGDANQTFESSGWDISNVYFYSDPAWLYIGVDTVGQFDNDGTVGGTGFTYFVFRIADNSGATMTAHEFILSVSPTETNLARINAWMFGFPIPGPVGAAYEIAYGDDLEIRIARGALSDINSEFYFIGKMDDLSDWSDDRVEGPVQAPEPMTLSLLGLGGLAFAGTCARRRRAA